MPEAIFAGDVPARITVEDFLRYFKQNFPDLSTPDGADIIREAIETVYTMFTGVSTLWDMQPRQEWYEKTVTAYRLLTAWYIADMYPMETEGVVSMGGIPLAKKRIGPTEITFASTQHVGRGGFMDLLGPLKSNSFGHKAYLMISTAAKRARLGGTSVV